ncbi:UPF0481 protein, partial [Mucuna pruriens]
MEGKPSGLLSEQQCLETKLTKILQNVEPPEMCGTNMQCIYRVPRSLRESNPKAYTPQIVYIGPFHRARDVGKENNMLESTEELKQKYLKGFLNRTQLPVRYFVVELQRLEEKIPSCYAEHIRYKSDDFLKMVLIDACFIIELFLRFHKYKDWVGKDPLLSKPAMLSEITIGLILLENQLPFFVLEELYSLTGMNIIFSPFLVIAIEYFENIGMSKKSEAVYPTECPYHFTDLLRTSIVSSSKFHLREQDCKPIEHLYSASQLFEAGLKFKVIPNESIVDLHYDEDVNILIDKKIIVNHMGDPNAVATMVNSLSLRVLMPFFDLKNFSLCNSLNAFYEKPLNKYKAIFIHKYFNTPWKIASTVAAILLLLLTLIQTICSIISLFKEYTTLRGSLYY